MAAGMAFTRALAQGGFDWNRLTHLAGNSGGNWFGTMLAYSQPFFDNLTDVSLPLDTAFMSFAQRYEVSSTAYDSQITNSMVSPTMTTTSKMATTSKRQATVMKATRKHEVPAVLNEATKEHTRLVFTARENHTLPIEHPGVASTPPPNGSKSSSVATADAHPVEVAKYTRGLFSSCQDVVQRGMCHITATRSVCPESCVDTRHSALKMGEHSVSAMKGGSSSGGGQGYGQGCSVFDPCASGLSCAPWFQTCYSDPRQLGEPCSAGYDCASGLTCQFGTQKCLAGDSAFTAVGNEIDTVWKEGEAAVKEVLNKIELAVEEGVEDALLLVMKGLGEHEVCKIAHTLFGPAILNTFGSLTGMYIAPFEIIVNALIGAVIDDFPSLTYDAPRSALPNASFIQMMTLPPDVWVNDQSMVSLVIDQANNPLITPAPIGTVPTEGLLLPVWHVAPGADVASNHAGVHGWQHPFAKGMTLTGPGGSVDASFPLSTSAQISQVTAGSSAAFGLFSSSTVLRNTLFSAWSIIAGIVQLGLHLHVPSLPADHDSIEMANMVVGCMPLMATEGVPLSLQPGSDMPWTTGSTTMPKAGQTPAFRAMDGAYSDNTALVSTVSTITTECSEGTRDCSSPPRIFLVNDNGGIGGSTALHDDMGGLSQFFSDAVMTQKGPSSVPVGEGVQGPLFGTTIPSSRIFSEAYSGLQWSTYASESLVYTSRYSIATLTTVSNPYWGVVGGQTLQIAFFQLGWNMVDALLVAPSAGTLGGAALKMTFETQYVPLAKAQVTGATPVLQDFLA